MIKKIPYINFIWPIIVALSVATVFYLINKKEREPVYAFKYPPSLIFNKEASTSKIKVIRQDSTIIEDNIYVTNIVLWNNGEIPINKTDIRKDFKIKLFGQGGFLDFKIIKESSSDISKFSLKLIENEIVIDWKYFDPKEGVEIQIVFYGNSDTDVNIIGHVLGNKVNLVKTRGEIDPVTYFAIIIALLGLIMPIKTILSLRKTKKRLSIAKQDNEKFHIKLLEDKIILLGSKLLPYLGILVIASMIFVLLWKSFFNSYILPF